MALFRIFRRCIGTEEVQQFIKVSGGGFERVLEKVKIVEAGNGTCIAELTVGEEHTNPMGGLHGGFSATLVDCITTYALFTHKQSLMIPSVSVDIHMSYLQGASKGDEIVINANTIKAGKTLGYLKCEITNKATGNILVKGSHTKYLMRPKDPTV